ncbi:MAG: DEAD/DEAH box helicase, partial [Oscillospiraceae bacterium]
MMKIFEGICCLKNVGKKREQQYNKLGIYSINDLLWHIPRGYIDFTSSVLISELKPGELFAVKAMVLSKSATKLRANLNMYTIRAADGRREIDIKLFNLFYTFNQIKIGGEYVFFGRVTKVGRFTEMNFMDYESTSHELRMRPIYSLTAGLSSKIVALNVAEALTLLQQVPDFMPLKFCRGLNLATFEYAMKNIHFPKNKEVLEVAGQRLATDELVMFNIGLLKQRVADEQTNKIIIKDVNLNEFLQTVDFEPTKAQLKVIDEIFGDIKQSKAMNRLVQGDVGCGKTFVAAAAIFAVCKSGFQAAVMAPTELLALQHYDYLNNILKKLGIKVECICGAKKVKEKREIALKLHLGEIDCLVGTHALLSDYVEFFNLGLVITDEQHKFGVKQREKLSNKGQNPHTLVMSATPIPRTLAMIMYDNLDISV